jgi:hypothetical protein
MSGGTDRYCDSRGLHPDPNKGLQDLTRWKNARDVISLGCVQLHTGLMNTYDSETAFVKTTAVFDFGQTVKVKYEDEDAKPFHSASAGASSIFSQQNSNPPEPKKWDACNRFVDYIRVGQKFDSNQFENILQQDAVVKQQPLQATEDVPDVDDVVAIPWYALLSMGEITHIHTYSCGPFGMGTSENTAPKGSTDDSL